MRNPTPPALLAAFVLLSSAALPARGADGPKGANEGDTVKLTAGAETIEVEIGGKPFTTYRFAGAGAAFAKPVVKPGAKPAAEPFAGYVRPFFFPVRAADGTEVTSDQATGGGDHPHHRSLWVAHGDVNGADHWSLVAKPAPPKQRHLRFDKAGGDTLVEQLDWEGPDAEPILHESRTVRFFAWPDGSRGVDFTLVFTPARGDVTFGDTKEAGLCSVRVAKGISAKPVLTNGAGQSGEKETWGKPADWCDESGEIDARPYGVAILDHPSNPRHPATWHVRQYGLMSANVFGLHDFDPKLPKGAGDFTIQAGALATFRYRVVIHAGDAEAAKIAQKYADYAGGR